MRGTPQLSASMTANMLPLPRKRKPQMSTPIHNNVRATNSAAAAAMASAVEPDIVNMSGIEPMDTMSPQHQQLQHQQQPSNRSTPIRQLRSRSSHRRRTINPRVENRSRSNSTSKRSLMFEFYPSVKQAKLFDVEDQQERQPNQKGQGIIDLKTFLKLWQTGREKKR